MAATHYFIKFGRLTFSPEYDVKLVYILDRKFFMAYANNNPTKLK